MTVGMTLGAAGWVVLVLLSVGSLGALLALVAGVICIAMRSLRPQGVRILLACLVGGGVGAASLPLFMLALTGSARLYDAPSWYFWASGGAGIVGFPVALASSLKAWRRRNASGAAV
jgi:hypothetical protein